MATVGYSFLVESLQHLVDRVLLLFTDVSTPTATPSGLFELTFVVSQTNT